LPYGYLSCERRKKELKEKEGERRKRETVKRCPSRQLDNPEA
jgi:hypothetical protein